MDMKPENKVGLIRGVVGVGTPNSGIITTDLEMARSHGTIVAHTHWYRHDDDLGELEEDLDALVRCYHRMRRSRGIAYGYEYKPYRK